jgi:hypothetical protein
MEKKIVVTPGMARSFSVSPQTTLGMLSYRSKVNILHL